MHWKLDSEEELLRETAHHFFSKHAPVSQLRSIRDGVLKNFDADTWQRMLDLGWAAMPWHESHGGLGFGFRGLGLVTQEAGRSLAVSPLFSSVWVAGSAIDLGGNEAQKCALLPQIAGGKLLVGFGLDETVRHSPYHVETQAVMHSGGYRLSGTKTWVLDGGFAQKLLLVARTSGAENHRDGLSLFLVDTDRAGIDRTPLKLLDSHNAARMTFNDVQIPADALVGPLGAGADILDRALDIARIGLSAELLGISSEVLERTVTYLKQREQFGKRLSAFQSLRHRCADIFCRLEVCQSIVRAALLAVDEGCPPLEIAKLASLAKAEVGETARLATREAVQMHGGIGMTDELDIGLFLKRATVVEQLFGTQDFHRDRFATLEGY